MSLLQGHCCLSAIKTKFKIMKQFLLLIRTEGDHLMDLNPDEQKAHVEKVGGYIGKLMQDGKLKSAQPLEMEEPLLLHQKEN